MLARGFTCQNWREERRKQLAPDEKAEALKHDWSGVFWTQDHDFRKTFYVLRSILLDRTLQGWKSLFQPGRLDRLTPLMGSFQKATLDAIATLCFNQVPDDGCEADAPIFKTLFDPRAAAFEVEARIWALFNPHHCGDKSRDALCNRWGLIVNLAKNLKRGERSHVEALLAAFQANLPLLQSALPGLRADSLSKYFCD